MFGVSHTDLESVYHPVHYLGCGEIGREILSNSDFPTEYLDFECIDAIEALNLDFALGNAIKYLWRAGTKKPWWKRSHSVVLEDLNKSKWYLERYLNNCYNVEYDSFPWSDSVHTSIVYYLVKNY